VDSTLNKYFDHIYLINLDSRPDRLKKTHSALSHFNIDYERFSAIHAPFETIPLKTCLEFEQNDPKYISGAYGCKLSHLGIIADAKEKQYDNILILEDDFILRSNYREIATSAFNQLSEYGLSWDMFYFGGLYQWGGFYKNGSRWFQEYVGKNVLKLKGAMTTLAYGLSSSLFDFILKRAVNEYCEIDIFYYKMHQQKTKFSYFGLIPPIFESSNSDSDIKA